MVRNLRLTLGILGTTVLLVVGLAAALPVQAHVGVDAGSSSTPTPVPTKPPASPGSGTRTGSNGAATASDCHLYAGPSGYGQACFHPGSTVTGRVLTIGEILSGDPLPTCWDTSLTDSDLSEARLQNTNTYTWFWQKCLTGIGPAPKYAIGPDGVKIGSGLVALTTGSTPPGLTVNQQRLVGMYAAGIGDYPPVVAVPAPSGKARVNQLIAFHGVPAVSPLLNVGGVAMQARVNHLLIHPLGSRSSENTECDGVGIITKVGDAPATTPPKAACWYRFRQSSADQPNQAFSMAVTATWQVRYTTNPNTDWNTWPVLTSDVKVTTITNQRVTEIQTIVVDGPR